MPLRPVTDQDISLLHTWRNAEGVRKSMYTQHEISKEEHQQWWKTQKDRTDRIHLIYEEDNIPLGYVGFSDINILHGRAEWAFYAGTNAPKGIGRAMEKAALAYAFTTLNLHKLCCEVLEYNDRVVRLHKAFGFVEEGVLREHMHINGIRHNVVLLSMLKSEWKGI